MHNQWSRFDAKVDDVIPLTVRSVQVNTGYTTTESFENYTKQQLIEFQMNNPKKGPLINWKEQNSEPDQNELDLESSCDLEF